MRLTVGLFVALLCIGCGSQQPSAEVTKQPAAATDAAKPAASRAELPEGFHEAAAKDGSFTIGLPAGWVPLTGDSQETTELRVKLEKDRSAMASQIDQINQIESVKVYAVDTTLLSDKPVFVDNVNVNVQPGDTPTFTDEAVADLTATFKQMFDDPGLTAGLVDVGGEKVYRYKAKAKSGGADYDILGFQYLHDKKVYTITISCASGKMAEREKLFDQIGKSLRFKG